MGRLRGTMIWVPGIIIEEIEDIKREDCLDSNAQAIYKMTQYIRVGREAKRIFKFDFSKAKTLSPLPPPNNPIWNTWKVNLISDAFMKNAGRRK